MASHPNHNFYNVSSLIRRTSNTDITSILNLLENKTNTNINNKIVEISRLLNEINEAEKELCDSDLIYYYFNMQRLTNMLQNCKDNMLKRLKALTNTYKCSVCKKQVELKYSQGLLENLQSHKCETTVHPDLLGASIHKIAALREYELHYNIYYDNNIKDKLFFKAAVERNEIIYFYTILLLNDAFFCLVCNCSISGDYNVLQHVMGQRHVKALNQDYDAVENYHIHFSKLKPEYQDLLREFCLENNGKVKCSRCNKLMLCTNIEQHLRSGCFELTSGVVDVRIKKSKIIGLREYVLHRNYDSNIGKEQFFKVVAEEDNELIYFYTILLLDDAFFCLVCHCPIFGNHDNVWRHTVEARHVNALRQDYNAITKYHMTFSQLKPKYQDLQKQFCVESDEKVKCFRCNIQMFYTSIQNHLESGCFIKTAGDHANLNKSGIIELQEYELHQNVYFDSNIEGELFFKVRIKESNEIVYIYTIVLLGDIFFCLLCDCAIFGDINVLLHIKGLTHRKVQIQTNDVNLSILIRKSQILQREFCLANNENMKCLKCNKLILFANVQGHLQSECFKRTTDEIHNYVKYNDLLTVTVYRNLLDWCAVIDGIKYPTLQNIENKIYCIVCNAHLENGILDHIISMEHRENLASKNTVRSLRKYHDIWCVQPVRIQMEQIYFRRGVHTITCTACDTPIGYDVNALMKHVESDNHKTHLKKYKDGNSSECGTSTSRSAYFEREGLTSTKQWSAYVTPRSASVGSSISNSFANIASTMLSLNPRIRIG